MGFYGDFPEMQDVITLRLQGKEKPGIAGLLDHAAGLASSNIQAMKQPATIEGKPYHKAAITPPAMLIVCKNNAA